MSNTFNHHQPIHFKQSSTTRNRGFTIVELLIVIVVIAILAAISIAAYNGIQERAKLTVTYQYISSYQKALMLLDTEGKLPTVNACLGPAEAYTNGCSDFGQMGTVQEDINNALKAAGAPSTALPVSKLVYAADFYSYKGVVLYRLPKVGLDCGVQNVMSRVSEVYGFYGAKNSGSGGGTTYCYIGTRTYK